MKKSTTGFTIVELLIVIVVIAILAAISIAAYTGIQNRANDSAVQSDLASFAKKIQLAAADTGEYPAGGRYIAVEGGSNVGTVTDAPQPDVSISVSKSSYAEPTSSGAVNFTYCTGVGLASGRAEYAVTGTSRSGKVFQYSSMRGSEMVGVIGLSTARACEGIGYPRATSWGYSINQGGWQSWTD